MKALDRETRCTTRQMRVRDKACLASYLFGESIALANCGHDKHGVQQHPGHRVENRHPRVCPAHFVDGPTWSLGMGFSCGFEGTNRKGTCRPSRAESRSGRSKVGRDTQSQRRSNRASHPGNVRIYACKHRGPFRDATIDFGGFCVEGSGRSISPETTKMTPRNTVDEAVNIRLEILLSELQNTTRDLRVLVCERQKKAQDVRDR